MANLGMKSFQLKQVSDVLEHDTNVAWYPFSKNVMYLNWKIRPNNYEKITPGGEAADAVIAYNAAQFDGDLLISLGYYDGIAVRRLTDDGTLEMLWSDSTPNNYDGGTCLGIDKIKHKVYVGSYNISSIEGFDYSGCVPTGNTVVSDGVFTKVGNNLPADNTGYAYYNGLAVAGDYLYFGDYESRSTMARWHVPTQTDDSLPVLNYSQPGYRGAMIYEEEHDRMWCLNLYNGGLWVTLSASTSADTALCYRVSVESLFGGNDTSTFMVISDEDNPNHVWLGFGRGRIAKFDITNSITGTGGDPTVLDYNTSWYNFDGTEPPHGMGVTFTTFWKHPIHGSKLILFNSDRYYNTSAPNWYDQETKLPLTKYYYSGYNYPEGSIDYGLLSSNDAFRFAYGGYTAIGTSSGTSQSYLIISGYGSSHGHRYRSYNLDNTPFDFEDEGNILFGQYSLPDDEDVGSILISNIYINILSGTSFEIWVSNNNKESWEEYDYSSDKYHVFHRRGNTVVIKFILKTTLPYKSPNFNSDKYPTVTIRGYDPLESPTRYKGIINKIKGKAI